MKTYKEKMADWMKRRENIYKLHKEGNLSYNEIGDKQTPRVTGQAIQRLIDRYKKQHGIA